MTTPTPVTVARRLLDVKKNWRVVTPPVEEQISLQDVYDHLRLFPTGSPPAHPEDRWISTFGIPAARQYCEGYLGRSLSLQTIELQLNRFSGSEVTDDNGFIELPMAPVASISGVSYFDSDGLPQTIASGFAVTDADPPLLYLSAGGTWPVTQAVPGAVKVRYVAGYSIPGASPLVTPELPAAIRIAMLLMIGHLYERREATAAAEGGSLLHEIPLGIAALLEPYRLRLSMA